MVKYEHDVITSDSDVIAPDSQTHVTSTAPSPYADFAAQVPECRFFLTENACRKFIRGGIMSSDI